MWLLLIARFDGVVVCHAILASSSIVGTLDCRNIDTEGIRTLAGRAQWISSPPP